MNDLKRLGLGLIGCGAFGQFCLNAFRDVEHVRIAAVADLVPDAADRLGRQFGVPAFHDPLELIAAKEVDIVHIATPPASHHGLALPAIAAGKHVLCEKPLAMDVRQGREILAAAASAGVVSPVNFVLRYNRVTGAVKAVIDSGVLGQVLSARLTNCASDSFLDPDHWFWNKAVSGGIFIEHGVHFFDLYRHWLGPGRVVSAHTETRPPTAQEDRVTCLVRHENSALVSHYHGFDQAKMMDRTGHRLVCELGDIRVEGWIPLTMKIEAVLDAAGAEKLAGCCPGGRLETLETYEGDAGRCMGRGRQRSVSRRVRLDFTPETDKQALYTQSVQRLLADQVAYIRDPKHARRVTEANGLASLEMAAAAVKLAECGSRHGPQQ